MTENGSHPEGLAPILRGLETLIADLDQKIEEAERTIAPMRAERRTLLAMLRAADPDRTKPGPKPKQATRRGGVSDEVIAKIRDAVAALPEPAIPEVEGSFTAKMLRDPDAGLNKSIVEKGLASMRERGGIRLVGERNEHPEGKGRASRVYALTDA